MFFIAGLGLSLASGSLAAEGQWVAAIGLIISGFALLGAKKL